MVKGSKENGEGKQKKLQSEVKKMVKGSKTNGEGKEKNGEGKSKNTKGKVTPQGYCI